MEWVKGGLNATSTKAAITQNRTVPQAGACHLYDTCHAAQFDRNYEVIYASRAESTQAGGYAQTGTGAAIQGAAQGAESSDTPQDWLGVPCVLACASVDVSGDQVASLSGALRGAAWGSELGELAGGVAGALCGPGAPLCEAATITAGSALGAIVGGIIGDKITGDNGTEDIYVVPGNATSSKKPYVGRAGDPNRFKYNRDGRDRSKAEIIRTVPKDAARVEEQREIIDRGGVSNLDNKRNEIAPCYWAECGIK
jgi:hypothetical protein